MTQLNGSNGSAIDPQVAISPSAPESLPDLLKQVEQHSKSFGEGDANARLTLVDAARSLVQAMETPQESILRYCWAQVGQSCILHIDRCACDAEH